MKRYFLSLFSCLVVCSCVSACSVNLPKKTYIVSFDYGNVAKGKASILLSGNLNLDGIEVRDAQETNKVIKKLYLGDVVDVYYKDKKCEEIDSVFVTRISKNTLEINYYVTPGSDGEISFFIDAEAGKDIRLNHSNVKYIVNDDYSFIKKEEADLSTNKLYATYEDGDYVDYNEPYEYTTVKVNAFYSFDPRKVN